MAVMPRPQVVRETPDVLLEPTPSDVGLSLMLSELLAESDGGMPVEVEVGGGGRLPLSPIFVHALRRICECFRLDQVVSLIPYESELTTQAAATLLGISRQRLIQLIDQGRVRARLEGTHRRLRLADVLEFRRTREVDASLLHSRALHATQASRRGRDELDAARRQTRELEL